MKKIIKQFLLPVMLLFALVGCEKDETRVTFEGGTTPVLSTSTNAANLNFDDAAKTAVVLSWTNPNYKFNSGVSSQSVKYLIEIDTVGSNFTNPAKKVIAVNGDLNYKFSVAELNDIMLNQLVLTPGQEHQLQFRVTASLDNTFSTLVSNSVDVSATPYVIPPKVQPPASGDLWIVGDATPNGWDNPLTSPHDVDQRFTMVTPTLYEITVQLIGGGGYKLIQELGVWGSQYHMLDGGTWESGDFEEKDADPQFPGAPEAGTYKITVDFQRGKYFVTKL